MSILVPALLLPSEYILGALGLWFLGGVHPRVWVDLRGAEEPLLCLLPLLLGEPKGSPAFNLP